jgi:hypothetical protein
MRLHYAHLKSKGDILEVECESISELIDYAKSQMTDMDNEYPIENSMVFLLSFVDEVNKKDLIFIDANPDFIIDIIRNTHHSFSVDFAEAIHIQEYESFEDCYAVALEMRECSDYDGNLTYCKKNNPNDN